MAKSTKAEHEEQRFVGLPSTDYPAGSDTRVEDAGTDRWEADDCDGQLGPDELPDPAEVVMNREAKSHH
jgi:hypothetical protein